MLGGLGDDCIDGGDGNDLIYGLTGNDTILGGGGDDSIGGGFGNDVIDGGVGQDQIDGGYGDDIVEGGDGDDKISGSKGDDTIGGGAGDDTITGGQGDDTLTGGLGNDSIEGGEGTDTVDYSGATGAVQVDLARGEASGAEGADQIRMVENIEGSDFDDRFHGDDASNVIDAGDGDDHVIASAGDDTLDGGSGTDTINYGFGTSGIDVDLTDNGVQTTGGGFGQDSLAGFERVIGTSFDDVFSFDNAQDGDVFYVNGGSGSDTLDLRSHDSIVVQSSFVDVNLTDGGSFRVNYDHIENIEGSSNTFTPVVDVAGNSSPVANAGLDQVANEGDIVTLNGAASTDVDGDSISYTWIQSSGPPVFLDDASSATPSFTAPQGLSNTDIEFTLQASDGSESSVDTVIVRVQADNDAPTANAGSDFITHEGDLACLHGGLSSDPEGIELTYTWTQISGPTVTLNGADTATPTFIAPEGLSNTDLVFELRVSDGTLTSADTVRMTVEANDDAPVADAGPNQAVEENQIVRLDGSASRDPEGGRLNYFWAQTGGPTVDLDDPTAERPIFRTPELLTNSTIEFELIVDDGVNTSVSTVQILVGADDDAPTAVAGPPQRAQIGDAITLNGGRSSDPEGVGLQYRWTQVGGPAVELQDPTAATPSFEVPTEAGGDRLVFRLAVSDGASTSTDTVSVIVGNPENRPPEVNVRAPASAGIGEFVALAANGTDPDNDALAFRWVQIDGPPVLGGVSRGPTLDFVAPEVTIDTNLGFRVIVSDGDAFVSQTVIVTIEAPDRVATEPVDPTTSADAADTAAELAPAVEPEPTSVLADVSIDRSATDTSTEASTTDGSTEADGHQLGNGVASLRSTAFSFASADAEETTDDASPSEADLKAVTQDVVSFVDPYADSDLPNVLAAPDLVVAEAGTDVELAPRIVRDSAALLDTNASPERVVWTQVGGTPVALDEAEGEVLRVQLPEVFVEEELVFEVQVLRDGEVITQEVTVQVQPVALTERTLSIDRSGPAYDGNSVGDDTTPTGFVAKMWAALGAAFWTGNSSRRRPRS